MLSLNQMLIDFDVAHLRAIASRLGVVLESNARRDIADQLTGALLTPDFLAGVVACLSPAEREALAELQRAGGRLRAHLFLHRYGDIRKWGAGRLERERPWETPLGAAESLWYKGLIGRGFVQEADGPLEFIFMPRELLARLPAPPAVAEPGRAAAPPASLEPAAGPDVLDDLFQLLLYTQLRRPRPATDTILGGEDAARLGETLGQPDPSAENAPAARLAFIQHYARRLGLIEAQAGRLRLASEPARLWLSQPAALQRRALQEAWRDDESWNDLWRVPSLRPEATGWANDPLGTRRRFLARLGELPAGQWQALDAFLAGVRSAMPDFQRPDGDYQSWYIHERDSGALLQGFEHWDEVEGALIAYYLRGPLQWLGIVGWSRPPAEHFRISAAGARFLAGEMELAGDLAGAPLQVGDDLTLILAPAASLYHRLQVERFAERAAGHLVYRITSRSLLTARSQEISLEAVRRFVEKSAGEPLSAEAEEELRRRWYAFARVRARRLVQLEFAAPEVLEWLRADAEAGPLLGKALSEQSVVVAESRLGRLLGRLRRLGLNPETISEPHTE